MDTPKSGGYYDYSKAVFRFDSDEMSGNAGWIYRAELLSITVKYDCWN